MVSEAGHHANRAYIGQDGAIYLNGAAFYNDAGADISASLEVLNDLAPAELQYLDGLTAGVVTASKALVVDANKDLGDLRNLDAVNLDAGASGTAGSVDVFPSTAAKGKLAITAADSAGDTTTTIVNASQAGARTYTIPDAGGAADFVMTAGDQTVDGVKTLAATGEIHVADGGKITDDGVQAAHIPDLGGATGGTADGDMEDVSTAVGTGGAAADKADVDARLVSIANNFEEIEAKVALMLAALRGVGILATS